MVVCADVCGLVHQARDTEARGARRHQEEQRTHVPVSASPRMTTAAVPGRRPISRGQRVGDDPYRGGARRVVQHRERHRGDHPHREHRRPAALAGAARRGRRPRGCGVRRLNCHPAARTSTRASDGADGARRDGDRDAERGAEQQARGQGERRSGEREDRHDDVGREERHRKPRTNRRRPVAELHGGGKRDEESDCDENHNRGRDRDHAAPRNLSGRRNDRRQGGADSAQRVDDGLHACQQYVAIAAPPGCRRRGGESSARRTPVRGDHLA